MDHRNRVEELFHEALALEASARGPFLAEACSTEPELLEEVTSLISAYEQPGSFIDTPAYDAFNLDDDLSDSLIGTSIGRYKVIRLIKRSGMGEVYLARDTHLPRDVALKLLPLVFTGDESRLRRFILEAEAVSSLNHPNILTIHEIGHVHDVHYIATEFVDGQTLRERLSDGPLEISEAVEIAIGVANALVASHAAGIVHRDIKPENIMIRRDGNIKVLDFGLAKLTERADIKVESRGPGMSKMDTDPGMLMGTIGYLSPEQANTHEVDTRSDLFSLGVVIYEMIAGKNPFNRDAFGEIIEAILRTEPAPLALSVPKAPASLQKIVSTALAKDKSNRYQHSEDLLADLKAVQAQLQPTTRRKLTPRERWLRISIGVVAVIVIAVLGSAVLRSLIRGRGTNGASDLSTRLRYNEVYSWKSARGEGTADPRFSHDGRMIAFTKMKNERESIWLKPTSGEAEPYELATEGANNYWPIWSPNDQRLAFVSILKGGKTGISAISVDGGAETFLLAFEYGTVRPRSWSRDGKTIYYEINNNLFGLLVDSRTTIQLTHFPSNAFRHFTVAPNEDRICYVEKQNGQSDIWVASLRGEAPHKVTNDKVEDLWPIWHPDGSRIVYTSNRGGAFQICVGFIDGATPIQLSHGGSDHIISDISSDGTKLLEVASQEDSSILGIDITTGREAEYVSGKGLRLWPQASPDGNLLLFHSTADGKFVTNGTILVTPTSQQGPAFPISTNTFGASWSPDGKQVAVLRSVSGKFDLFTVGASGEGERQLTRGGVSRGSYNMLPTTKLGLNFCWAEQGDRIIYSSTKSGASNLWAVAADGSTDTQLSTNTDSNLILSEPTCGPDGRIAFMAEARRGEVWTWSLWVIDSRNAKRLLESNWQLRPIGWSAGGDRFTAASAVEEAAGNPTTVKLIEVSLDGTSQQTSVLPATYYWAIQLSPDRKTIAYISDRDGSDNIWEEDLKAGIARKLTSNNEPKIYFPGLSWSANGNNIYYGKQTRLGLINMIDNFE